VDCCGRPAEILLSRYIGAVHHAACAVDEIYEALGRVRTRIVERGADRGTDAIAPVAGGHSDDARIPDNREPTPSEDRLGHPPSPCPDWFTRVLGASQLQALRLAASRRLVCLTDA